MLLLLPLPLPAAVPLAESPCFVLDFDLLLLPGSLSFDALLDSSFVFRDLSTGGGGGGTSSFEPTFANDDIP